MVDFNWFLRAGGFTKHTTKCSRPIRPYHSASCLDPVVFLFALPKTPLPLFNELSRDPCSLTIKLSV